jgi:Fe-S oxidoreductase
MYSTSNDGFIREWCVGHYDHEELVIDARSKLFEKGLAPDEVKRFVEDLRTHPLTGKSPSEILAGDNRRPHAGAEVLLYAGCSVRESQSGDLVHLARLLDLAGVACQVLEEEPCCGWPLYQLGDWEGARELSQRAVRAAKESGASTIVFLDADCYRMFVTRSLRFGADSSGIKFAHAAAFLSSLIDEGKIRVDNPIDLKATYHDPCALARFCPETEEPRRVLQAVLKAPLLEMAKSRNTAQCCGAGGMLPVYRPDLSREFALLRLEEAVETGAELLVTGCSRCRASLGGADKAKQREVEVVSLVELLSRAVSSK